MKQGLVVGLILAGARVAGADDAYPQTIVDRPLVVLPGMTELFLSEQRWSTPTHTIDRGTLDLQVGHAFGPVEILADIGEYAVLDVDLATHAFPESVEVWGLTGVPQRDNSLIVAQGAAAAHRFHVVPGVLAVTARVGGTLSEDRRPDAVGMLTWSQVLSGTAGCSAEVQVLSALAVTAGVSVAVPLAHSAGLDVYNSLSAGAGVIVALGTWDLYASGGLGDLTDRRLPYLTAGFAKRWGR